MERKLRGMILVAAVVAAAGCSATGEFAGSTDQYTATVEKATDGDTLDVSSNGTKETVRLVGVDTPEKFGEVSPEEFDLPDTERSRNCLRDFADRSSARMESLEGQEVKLARDSVQDDKGSYGRSIRYMYNGTDNYNLDLVRDGYARVYVSDFVQLEEFKEAQNKAREENRGIWGCVS
jgi:micrococcal nuclease